MRTKFRMYALMALLLIVPVVWAQSGPSDSVSFAPGSPAGGSPGTIGATGLISVDSQSTAVAVTLELFAAGGDVVPTPASANVNITGPASNVPSPPLTVSGLTSGEAYYPFLVVSYLNNSTGEYTSVSVNQTDDGQNDGNPVPVVAP